MDILNFIKVDSLTLTLDEKRSWSLLTSQHWAAFQLPQTGHKPNRNSSSGSSNSVPVRPLCSVSPVLDVKNEPDFVTRYDLFFLAKLLREEAAERPSSCSFMRIWSSPTHTHAHTRRKRSHSDHFYGNGFFILWTNPHFFFITAGKRLQQWTVEKDQPLILPADHFRFWGFSVLHKHVSDLLWSTWCFYFTASFMTYLKFYFAGLWDFQWQTWK